jgi:imidazolonepropionase-like amidohydrolase
MMTDQRKSSLSRRDFIKLSAMATAALSLPAAEAEASLLPRKSPKIDYRKELRLTNCNLVDVKTGQITAGATVRIKEGRIISAGTASNDLSADAEIIDLKGKYVIPGLVHGHLHMTLPPVSAFRTGLVFSFLPMLLGSFRQNIEKGITTVRDMAALSPLLHYCTRAVEKGSLVGPRVVTANTWLGVEGGYIDLKPADVTILLELAQIVLGDLMIKITDVDKQEALLRDNIVNASYIKLASLDRKSLIAGKQDAELKTYSDKQLKALFDFAAKHERPVAAHIMTAEGFRRALQYPIRYMEHIVYDSVLSDDDIQAMADKRVTIIPTMVLGNLYAFEEAFETLPAGFKSDFVENEVRIRREYWNSITKKDIIPVAHAANNDALGYFKEENYDTKAMIRNRKFTLNPVPFLQVLTNGRENLRKMKAAGITIGAGTDSGVPMNYHGTLWRELEMFSRLGFSHLEILQMATMTNAKICLMEDKIGSLDPGKFADVVVLENNPLTEITAYRNPLLVFKDGRLQVQKTEIQRLDTGLALNG